MVNNNKNLLRSSVLIILALMILVSTTGCSVTAQASDSLTFGDLIPLISSKTGREQLMGWTKETHSKYVEPNYEVVFPQDSVNRIEIIISAKNWETMVENMTEMVGEFGKGGGMGMLQEGRFQAEGFPDFSEGNPSEIPFDRQIPDGEIPQMQWGGEPPENMFPDGFPEGREIPGGAERPEDIFPDDFPEGRENPGGDKQLFEGNFMNRPDGGGGNLDFTVETPVWVPATINFEGSVWENVGIRFKGNSSLQSTWSSGSLKIPFKIDFDQFEDDYPEIKNQRFYGFKQLSLANNFSDESYLREKVTADIFREFGVPSAHTAFYEVYVDYGEGLEYFGLYTLVEMVKDTVIKEQFSDNTGNLYKPEGTGATFAEGSFNKASFDKKTNQAASNYADIVALFEVLHGENRLSNPEEWRSALESVFNVDIFLRWLAVNTIVQNWDTYGNMSHNYFLYNDPESNLLTWIPWDNNMALSTSDSMAKERTASLSLDEVTDRWPLISFLMDDPVYQAQYKVYLKEVVENVFYPEKMTPIYTTYHDLISASVLKENNSATTLRSRSTFDNSLQELIDHVNQQYSAVIDFLAD